MTKTMRGGGEFASVFKLHVEPGQFTDSEIIVMLGENGTGKTTFIRMLAGLLKSDEAVEAEEIGDFDRAAELGVPSLNIRFENIKKFTFIILFQIFDLVLSLRRFRQSSKELCVSYCTKKSVTHIFTHNL